MRNLLKRGKALLLMAVSAVTAVAAGVCASAEASANEAVVTAMTKTANDMVATGTAIVPVALGVIGLSLVVIFGIRMFKRIANKG